MYVYLGVAAKQELYAKSKYKKKLEKICCLF